MGKRRTAPKPKRPDTVFGWCSLNLRVAFNKLGDLVDANFWPSPIPYKDLEDLLLRPGHATIIRQARELVGFKSETQQLQLPVWADRDPTQALVKGYAEFDVSEFGRIKWPNYALDGSQQALLSDSTLYQQYRHEVLLWHEARSRVKIARRVFDDLDSEPGKYRPRHVRYLMPSILPMLRMALIITQKNWDDEKNTMLKQFNEHIVALQEADGSGYTTPPETPYDFRAAMALTNQTIATMLMLEKPERAQDAEKLRVQINTWQTNRWFVPEIDYCFNN